MAGARVLFWDAGCLPGGRGCRAAAGRSVAPRSHMPAAWAAQHEQAAEAAYLRGLAQWADWSCTGTPVTARLHW